jgi:hypothetical protein
VAVGAAVWTAVAVGLGVEEAVAVALSVIDSVGVTLSVAVVLGVGEAVGSGEGVAVGAGYEVTSTLCVFVLSSKPSFDLKVRLNVPVEVGVAEKFSMAGVIAAPFIETL